MPVNNGSDSLFPLLAKYLEENFVDISLVFISFMLCFFIFAAEEIVVTGLRIS